MVKLNKKQIRFLKWLLSPVYYIEDEKLKKLPLGEEGKVLNGKWNIPDGESK